MSTDASATTTAPASAGERVHVDSTPPMSAPTYRACSCGWSTSGSSHSSAVTKLEQHLARGGDGG